jgi:hypothetical protein
MAPSAYASPSRKLGFVLIALTGLCLVSTLAGISGCKPLEADAVPADTTAMSGTASLRITNNISDDPDSLVFFLFPGTATNFINAANARKVGGVDENATSEYTVPAGTWKLAYENSAGVLTAMRDLSSDEWVKSVFKKDGAYSLILANEGKDIKWNPSFQTIPDIN